MISIDHDPSADDNEPASAALIPSVQSSPALCAPSPLLANAHTPASSQPQPPSLALPHLFAARITYTTAHTQSPQPNQNHALLKSTKWEGSSPYKSKRMLPRAFLRCTVLLQVCSSFQGLNPRLPLNLLPIFLVEQVGERRLPPMTAPVAS